MGRIYRSAPSADARQNSYRWQDDPETGEFSNYGRGRWNIAAMLLLLMGGLALAAVVLGAVAAIVSSVP